jgi:hypothetical protein
MNNYKKQIALTILIFFSGICAHAQWADVIILKTDTMRIFTDPLESMPNNNNKAIFYFDKDTCTSPKCVKGYVGEWLIDEDKLYLKNLFNCCYEKDSIAADLKKKFGKKYKKEMVFADWYTGKILAYKGKVLFKDEEPSQSIYEKEVQFKLEKGEVKGTKKFDNSKTKISTYYSNSASLTDFLESNINWKKIPPLKDRILFVDITFSADSLGKITKANFAKKEFDQIYYDEAVRVIKKIPNWNVLYLHGVFKPKAYVETIEFSEEIRKKYVK